MGKLIVLFLSLSFAASELKANTAYRLIDNALIYAGASDKTYSAMVLNQDKVVAIGGSDALRQAYPDAKRIDMNGQAILPGLVDSHIHPFLALERTTCSLDEGNGLRLDEIIEQVQACLANVDLTAEWITVNNYNGYGAESASFLSGFKSVAAGLNQISDTKPVILIGLDGHAYAVNQFALDNKAGNVPLNQQSLEREYAKYRELIGQASDGNVNGIIKSQAAWDLFAYDTSTADDFANNPSWLNTYLLSNGITSAHETFAQDRDLQGYYRLAKTNSLIPRIYLSVVFNKDDLDIDNPKQSVDKFINRVLDQKRRFKGLRAQIVGIKIMVDGVVEFPQQTAAMLQPYLNAKVAGDGAVHYDKQDRTHKGVLELDQETLNRLVTSAALNGLRVHFHAIGDGAVEASIRAVERSVATQREGVIHTVSHLQQVTKQQISDMARLNIAASYTPAWAVPWKEYDASVIPYLTTVSNIENIDDLYQSDSDYFKKLYPINSMVKAGITVAFGSDAPVDSKSPRPFSNMVAAISRSSVVETSSETKRVVFNESEQVNVEASLDGFMRAAATSIGSEKIGRLAPGSYADFIVLSHDWVGALRKAVAAGDYQQLETLCDKSVNDLCSTQVVETWVGGEKRWHLRAN